jgi:hypothetical protein
MAKTPENPKFIPVKVMDPISGCRKRMYSQEELDKHLAHGWIVWET